LVEFCGHLGFEYVFIDGEHAGVGIETCQHLVRAAHGVGMGVVVRVPSHDPSVILGYLETGAFTIVVPHVNTPAQAAAAVAAGRYPPAGARGAGSASRAANYGLTQTAAEYFVRANTEVLIIPLIEDIRAVDNVRDILAVPGVEAIDIGPGDLAASVGFPGHPDHPEVTPRIARVISAAKSAGKLVGCDAGTPAGVRALAVQGVDFVMCNALKLLADAGRLFLSGVGENVSNHSEP